MLVVQFYGLVRFGSELSLGDRQSARRRIQEWVVGGRGIGWEKDWLRGEILPRQEIICDLIE